jgi:hypothetical chaperone protein
MSTSQPPVVGIDFGTTNSSVAVVTPSGQVQVARFPYLGAVTDAYRSLLYFERAETGPRTVQCWTGPAAIEHYLAAENKGRLIQSLKSFLGSRSLVNTNVLGRSRSIEDLIARILTDLREDASRQFGFDIREATVGRPVRFVGSASDEDDGFAEARLAEAFKTAGFERVSFELEPVAAAHQYESTLQHDELILIGDFGGGTSDFSLINVGAAVRRRGRQASDLLGTAGLGLAGDAFDAQIVRHLVSPALGAGSEQRSTMGRLLAVPAWPYASLERWHHLSFLKTNEVMTMLDTIKWQAVHPDRIEALIHLIKNDLGYQLHQAVQRVKCDLSCHREAKFAFTDGDLTLDAIVYRADFESWIGPDLTQIETCVDSLLERTSVARKDVDAVFLTGGSSFVPAVRRLFVNRFGEHKIRAGNEFTSVAMGLAWKAASNTSEAAFSCPSGRATDRP